MTTHAAIHRWLAPGATVGRRWTWGLLAALVVGGVYSGFWRYQAKRFQVVRPGVLLRVGQPSEFGLRYLVERHQARVRLLDGTGGQGLRVRVEFPVPA